MPQPRSKRTRKPKATAAPTAPLDPVEQRGYDSGKAFLDHFAPEDHAMVIAAFRRGLRDWLNENRERNDAALDNA